LCIRWNFISSSGLKKQFYILHNKQTNFLFILWLKRNFLNINVNIKICFPRWEPHLVEFLIKFLQTKFHIAFILCTKQKKFNIIFINTIICV
jgi:hypothetical protein